MANSRPVSRASRAKASKYDAAYKAKKDFVARPNMFLDRCLERIAGNQRSRRKRLALDIGLGQGRNAILLARRGYLTTGIDRSDVGVRDALRLASSRGLQINAVLADTEKYDFGRNRWDVILLMYYPQPMFL